MKVKVSVLFSRKNDEPAMERPVENQIIAENAGGENGRLIVKLPTATQDLVNALDSNMTRTLFTRLKLGARPGGGMARMKNVILTVPTSGIKHSNSTIIRNGKDNNPQFRGNFNFVGRKLLEDGKPEKVYIVTPQTLTTWDRKVREVMVQEEMIGVDLSAHYVNPSPSVQVNTDNPIRIEFPREATDNTSKKRIADEPYSSPSKKRRIN